MAIAPKMLDPVANPNTYKNAANKRNLSTLFFPPLNKVNMDKSKKILKIYKQINHERRSRQKPMMSNEYSAMLKTQPEALQRE